MEFVDFELVFLMAAGITGSGPSLDSAPVSTTREAGSSWRANQEIDKPRNNSGIPMMSVSRRFSLCRDPVKRSDVSVELEFAEVADIVAVMLELAQVSCTRSNV